VAIYGAGPAIEQLEADLGISSNLLASAVGVDKKTVQRWKAGTHDPQGKSRQRFKELLELRIYMLELLGTPEAAQDWLNSQSVYLGNFTPAEALKAGRLDRVRADLDGLAAGVYL
jgi:uncharacterized protein (DUF2384 family)